MVAAGLEISFATDDAKPSHHFSQETPSPAILLAGMRKGIRYKGLLRALCVSAKGRGTETRTREIICAPCIAGAFAPSPLRPLRDT
jgi:hypothetical protein